MQTLELQFINLARSLDQNLYQTTEIWIYYVNSSLVTDLSVKAGTIHGKADLIRYAFEIPAKICELYECCKHLYIMLIRFMYARMI